VLHVDAGQARGTQGQADGLGQALGTGEQDLGAAAAHVDHDHLAIHGAARLYAQERQHGLLLVAQGGRLEAGHGPDPLDDGRTVGRATERVGAGDGDRPRSQAARVIGKRAERLDEARNGAAEPTLGVDRPAEPEVRRLIVAGLQLVRVDIGDQQMDRVRADVDRRGGLGSGRRSIQ